MVVSLTNAEIFDCEVLPNCFTFSMEMLNSDTKATWEISDFRDDRQSLLEHFRYLQQTQTPLIGFNSVSYDYPIIHMLWMNPNATTAQLYQKSQQIIGAFNRWEHRIYASDRFCPQIDLYLMHHFDNKAKSTGLKTLQIAMRSDNVVESELPFDRPLTQDEIDNDLIPYNIHDVSETKRFCQYSMDAIRFRQDLIEQFGVDVLNWNDTKIGEQMMIQRLGDEVCYDRSSGRRQMRQSPRSEIRLADIIFPYIRFEHPEFNRVLDYLRGQTLRADEFKEDAPLTTKGVFTGLSATVGMGQMIAPFFIDSTHPDVDKNHGFGFAGNATLASTVNGFQFDYGVGGIHGSVKVKRVVATDEYPVRDIDVAALYPSIAIKNGLYPEHLGQRFVTTYAQLPAERKQWQEKKGKKCPEANALKLAGNGTYGKSNSVYSPMYDPRFTMSITINGQLLLSMLAEKLLQVPTLTLIAINTDGMTYQIHRNYLEQAKQVERDWEQLTQLTLEDVAVSRMWIRDVNNYVSQTADGAIKLKGAYWSPDPLNYHQSISDAQPVSWHKKFDSTVSTRAAVAHMVHGVDIEQFIRMTTNPFDFCNSVKVNRSDVLMWGDKPVQRNTRFYVSTSGQPLVKLSPPPKGKKLGDYRKANGVSDAEYERLNVTGQWDERIHTKNQSKYEERRTSIEAGYKVTVVNNINDFNWETVNYDYYLTQAHKLVI